MPLRLDWTKRQKRDHKPDEETEEGTNSDDAREGRSSIKKDGRRETTARTEAQTSATAAEKRRGSAQHSRAGKAHRQYGKQRYEGQMRRATTIARGMAASHRHLGSTRTRSGA